MIGIKKGALDGLELGRYDISELLPSEFSTDGTADRNFDGLLLRVQLISVFGREFGRVLGATLGVLDDLQLGTYVGIELVLS